LPLLLFNHDLRKGEILPRLTNTDEFTSTSQASKALGVAVRTIQIWTDAGILPAWRSAGGHRYISRAAVNCLVESRQKTSTTANKRKRTHKRGTRLLLISPSSSIQKAASRYSHDALLTSYKVAECPAQGLLAFGESQSNFVVLDLSISGVDVVEFAKFLRAEMSSTGNHVLLAVQPSRGSNLKGVDSILPHVTAVVSPQRLYNSLFKFSSMV
jgi:excisionase family DNA binding protein